MKLKICGIDLNSDNIMSQKELKDFLLQLKMLFDDLTAAKSASVKNFIMKEVFSSLGKIEKTADQMYCLIDKADKAIEQVLKKIDSNDKLHQLQAAWWNKAHHDEMESLQFSKEDISDDRAIEKLSISEDSEEDILHDIEQDIEVKDDEAELPKDEQDCYTRWLKDQTLQNIDEADITPLTLDEIMNSCGGPGCTERYQEDKMMSAEEFFGEGKKLNKKNKKPSKEKKTSKKASQKKSSNRKASNKPKKV